MIIVSCSFIVCLWWNTVFSVTIFQKPANSFCLYAVCVQSHSFCCWPCSGLISVCWHLSCTEEPQNGHSMQRWSECWVEVNSHFPWPSGYFLTNATQDTVSLFAAKVTHDQLVQKDTQIFSIELLLHISVPRLYCYFVFQSQIQDFEFLVSPFFQLVEITPEWSPSLWLINHPIQFSIIHKFPESAFCPIIQAVLKTLTDISCCVNPQEYCS